MSSGPDTRYAGGALTASLYVHVPFCLAKCGYCAFHSVPVAREPGLSEHFAWAVAEGTAHWAALGALDEVASVYIGGGTPTTLGPALVPLVDTLLAGVRLSSDAEITVETNPDTTDAVLVGRLAAGGVTRFSLGVQSFDDGVLRTLGRCHTAEAADRALDVLTGTGARVSLDLMCGVPGQTLASWTESVERALSAGVGHVSVYPLSLEEGTALSASVSSGSTDVPDEDLAAEMMEAADHILTSSGLHRYEIASYARDGEQSVHNTGYWTGRPYIGVGPSAASMLPAELFQAAIACEAWTDPGVAGVGRTLEGVPAGIARVRFARAPDTIAFLRKPVGPPEEVEFLTVSEAAAEDAMLGLRRSAGISAELARAAGAVPALTELASRGLVAQEDGRWRATRSGWLFGNEVFGAVWNAGARRGLA